MLTNQRREYFEKKTERSSLVLLNLCPSFDEYTKKLPNISLAVFYPINNLQANSQTRSPRKGTVSRNSPATRRISSRTAQELMWRATKLPMSG